MRLAFLICALATALAAQAADPHEKRPGFGAVESVIPVKPQGSAGAGGTAPGKSPAAKAGYLLRIKMDDGSIQIRQVSRKFSAGQRVLLTNAGDVLPD